MAYLVSELINRAYYLSGIAARGLQTVTGPQQADGLFLFQSLLSAKAADPRMVPYYQYETLNLIQGQELYFVENLISIDSATFNIGPVRYATQKTPRMHYFGDPRVDDIQSLPFSWNLERTLGGANIRVYFLPQANYAWKFIGKFFLTNVDLFTDLTLFFDGYYIEYFRFALANYICLENNITFSPENIRQLREYEQIVTDISPLDLTTQITSTLNKGGGITWAQINISHGYTPG